MLQLETFNFFVFCIFSFLLFSNLVLFPLFLSSLRPLPRVAGEHQRPVVRDDASSFVHYLTRGALAEADGGVLLLRCCCRRRRKERKRKLRRRCRRRRCLSAAAFGRRASLSALCAGETDASAAAVAADVAAFAAASTAEANPYQAPNCSFRIASAASCRALTAAGLAAAAAFRAASAFCSRFLRKRAAAAKGSSMAPPWPDIIAATPGRSGVVFLRGFEGREKEREERSEFLFLFFFFSAQTEKKNPKKSKKLPKPLTRQDLLRHVLQRGKVLLLDPMDA